MENEEREFTVRYIERQRNAVLAFHQTFDEPRHDHVVTYTAELHHAFKPVGLMVFGVTRETWIRQVRIGNQIVCPINSCDGIPAEFYAAGIPLSDLGELTRQLQPGESHRTPSMGPLPVDERVLRALKQGTPKRCWVDWPTVKGGLYMEFTIQGPFHSLVCWGSELTVSEKGSAGE